MTAQQLFGAMGRKKRPPHPGAMVREGTRCVERETYRIAICTGATERCGAHGKGHLHLHAGRETPPDQQLDAPDDAKKRWRFVQTVDESRRYSSRTFGTRGSPQSASDELTDSAYVSPACDVAHAKFRPLGSSPDFLQDFIPWSESEPRYVRHFPKKN